MRARTSVLIVKPGPTDDSKFSMQLEKVTVYGNPSFWILNEDTWIPQGQTVTVAGRQIAGMVYLGERDDYNYYPWADPVIDPRLIVDNCSFYDPFEEKRILYYLRYHVFRRDERAEYLDWLASDRVSVDCHESYIRLYFYGLERRFFMDSPTQEERHAIITEVERLLKDYVNLNDFSRARREMSHFLYTACAVIQPPEEIKPRFEVIGKEMPIDVNIAIGHLIKTRQPLNADWCLSWYATDSSTSQLRTAARRAFPEFRVLFKQLFEKNFPNGVMPDPPSCHFYPRYDAASKIFFVNLGYHSNNPLSFAYGSSLPGGIAEIVDEATEALDKYSRFLGKCNEGRDSIEAYTLLPQSLRHLFPNAAIKELQKWAETVVESGGLVEIERVVERVEETRPEKITKRHITTTASALALLSIGMAPDPRFDLRGPKLGEPVVLFRLIEPATELNHVSDEYQEALLSILAGGFIAHADDLITEEEKAALDAHIGSISLPEPERDRLLANLQWILTVPPHLVGFQRHLKKLSKQALHRTGKFALFIAAVDGAIEPAEIKALEKLYKVMGLRPDSIYSDLHTLFAPGAPKTILFSANREEGFTISPSNSNQPVVLDEKQISSLMAETAKVSALLGDIFEEKVQEKISTASNGSKKVFEGLDAEHSSFLRELLSQNRWKKSDYTALAERFQLMQEGSLETLNEWSFERFEDILIDEDTDYELNPEISTKLGQ